MKFVGVTGTDCRNYGDIKDLAKELNDWIKNNPYETIIDIQIISKPDSRHYDALLRLEGYE